MNFACVRCVATPIGGMRSSNLVAGLFLGAALKAAVQEVKSCPISEVGTEDEGGPCTIMTLFVPDMHLSWLVMPKDHYVLAAFVGYGLCRMSEHCSFILPQRFCNHSSQQICVQRHMPHTVLHSPVADQASRAGT